MEIENLNNRLEWNNIDLKFKVMLFTLLAGGQIVIIYLNIKGYPNFAFWTIALPFFIYLSICRPTYALIFLLLFTLFDFTYLVRLYTKHHIHALFFGPTLFPMNFVLILILWLGILINSLRNNKIFIKFDPLGFLIVLFLLFILIKHIAFKGFIEGLLSFRFLHMTIVLSSYFIYTNILDSEKKIRILFKWLWIGGGIVMVYGFYQLISGNYTQVPWISGLPYILNEAIVVNLYIIVFSFFVFLYQKENYKLRLLGITIILLYFILVLFSFKRGALVSGLIGFLVVFVVLLQYKTARGILKISFIILLGAVLIQILSSILISNSVITDYFFTRLESISLKNVDASGAMRIAQWVQSYNIMHDNPIWGSPPDEIFKLSFGGFDLDTVIDCNYLYIGVYFGTPALILFLFILICAYYKLVTNLIKVDRKSFMFVLTAGALGALISLTIADLFEVHTIIPKVGPYYVLILALSSIGKKFCNENKT